ncbi:hypothetical protein BX666DRAFT_1880970 [Dichotomocladium elegans]|nr:hypothetical protein BX666DRAFT_1880970 [Dichotomocladium elegans]
MTNPDQINRPSTITDLQEQKSLARVSMEPLFERLLKRTFPDSVSAIEHCRNLCAEFGFTVKQEASANRNIYVYCSREGLPDSQRNPKPSPQRKRPSKRCDCRWRVVLSENEHDQWEFRKSMNPNASEHNHEMMSPDEMVKAWPAEVNQLIIQLARQRLQTHEIREAVKTRFPDITWNERRFYNRLTEERKRIKQRGVLDRSQRLLIMSARLCAVVTANDDWTNAVEAEMTRMLDNFCQLSRLPPESIASLSDLQPDMIQTDGPIAGQPQQRHSSSASSGNESDGMSPTPTDMNLDEVSPTKKRKSLSSAPILVAPSRDAPKGAQTVYVPGYTLFVRHQPMRSSSEPSSQQVAAAAGMSRRAFIGSPPDLLSSQHQTSPMGAAAAAAFGQGSAVFSLASPSSSSSSSTSSLPFHQRQPQQSFGRAPPPRYDGVRVSSPMQHTSISPHDTAPPFVAYQQQHHQAQQPSHAAAPQPNYAVAQTTAAVTYNPMANFGPFSAAPAEIPFTFDGGMAGSFPPQQHHSRGALERPEPTHPHDVAYRHHHHHQQQQTQQQQQQSSSFGFYSAAVKEEQLPDQRILLHHQQQQQQQQQQRDQRMQRSMSQQDYMPTMMRATAAHDSNHHPHHHIASPSQHQQPPQSEWA